MELMKKPTQKELPFGVIFRENDYELIKGERFFCEFNDDKHKDPIWVPVKNYSNCDPNRIYKVWYQYHDASDPADTDIHKNIYYIEDYEELNNLMNENAELHDIISYCYHRSVSKKDMIEQVLKAYKIKKVTNFVDDKQNQIALETMSKREMEKHPEIKHIIQYVLSNDTFNNIAKYVAINLIVTAYNNGVTAGRLEYIDYKN